MLLDDDRIRPVGEWCAGKDANRLTGAQFAIETLSRSRFTYDGELRRIGYAVRSDECITVHGGSVERGCI